MKENIEPIDIVLVTFNRLNFLKHTVEKIYERTRYPHRLWVIDNCSEDGTQDWLKSAKLHGFVHDYILLEENKGLATGLSEGFKKVKSEFFITTQDDVVPPDLTPCWLERMLGIAKDNPDYGGIAMRIQRIRHREVDENKESIESPTSLASVFRIQKKNDIEEVEGFGSRPHWESTDFVNRTKQLKKKYGVTTHLYADHIGFMADNKGFEKGFTNYRTYAKERVTQGKEQPYPDIEPKSNIPIKINTKRDRGEQEKREERWEEYGVDRISKVSRRLDQVLLKEYAAEGKGLDIGCGRIKCHENAIGMDVFPFSSVDILAEGNDLWMFKDNELDFIVASHSLEHFADTKKVLKEWVRVLKSGGILGVAVPDGGFRPGTIVDKGHKVALTVDILKHIFKRVLRMKLLRLELINEGNTRNQNILIVAKKR